ncbi:MAG: sensor histidine kinase [Gemmatimonadaceae bacterium]
MSAPESEPSRQRAHLWRLPLAVFLVFGLAGLLYVDALLRSEYRERATTQTVQAKALLEGFVRQGASLLHALRSVVETSPSPSSANERFLSFARQVREDAPQLHTLLLLDREGNVRAVFPAGAGGSDLAARLRRSPQHARGIHAAASTGRTVTVALPGVLPDGPGIAIYDPVRDSVSGFVAAVMSHQGIFNEALTGQLQGEFAYQVRDDAGRVIARSPKYPERISSLVTRTVAIPGGGGWMLEVAVPAFAPLLARLLNWTSGLLFLFLVILLVVREQAQSARFAERTRELEALSQSLLEANVRLEERARQIAEANRAKSRFLANVSHELRTPLNAIVGYNALARDGVYGDLPEQVSRVHARIAAAAEHLLTLVDEVLDLAKIEVGRMAVDTQLTDVSSIIDAVVTVVAPMAGAKELQLSTVTDRGLPAIVTDPGLVKQILLNLTANAIKFTERGSITIRVRRDAEAPLERVAITVDDTGIGIASSEHDRIFEEFEQVRPGGRGDSLVRGTGLGLSISRKLARLLGGDVRVASAPGEGSRFTLLLPFGPPKPDAGQEEEPLADRTRDEALAGPTVVDERARSAPGGRVGEMLQPSAASDLDGGRKHD